MVPPEYDRLELVLLAGECVLRVKCNKMGNWLHTGTSGDYLSEVMMEN